MNDSANENLTDLWANLERVRRTESIEQSAIQRLAVLPWEAIAPDDIRIAWLKITDPKNLSQLLLQAELKDNLNLYAQKYLEQAIVEARARRSSSP